MRRIVWTRTARAHWKSMFLRLAGECPQSARAMNDARVRKLAIAAESPEYGCLGRVAGTRELRLCPQDALIVYAAAGDVLTVLEVIDDSPEP